MRQFNVRQEGKYTVVEFTAPSLMDPTDLELIAESLHRLIDEQDRRWFLMDFEQVRYLSSQAISILLAMQRKLAMLDNSKLVLCGVGPRLMELLRITRLDRVLTVKPTQKDVLGAEGGAANA